MATKTLTGSGNHTDAIWSPAGTPGADDDVIFDADYSLIDETITVSNSFPTTVGRLTVDMGGTITVDDYDGEVI